MPSPEVIDLTLSDDETQPSPLTTKTSLKAYFPHLSLKLETFLSEEEDSESEQELIV